MTVQQINALPENILIDGDIESREIYINGKLLTPTASQKIRNHSPDGFNWGYGGSGPAQLSLAILLKYLPKEDACNLYQEFKFKYVAAWPRTDFEIPFNLKAAIEKLVTKSQLYKMDPNSKKDDLEQDSSENNSGEGTQTAPPPPIKGEDVEEENGGGGDDDDDDAA